MYTVLYVGVDHVGRRGHPSEDIFFVGSGDTSLVLLFGDALQAPPPSSGATVWPVDRQYVDDKNARDGDLRAMPRAIKVEECVCVCVRRERRERGGGGAGRRNDRRARGWGEANHARNAEIITSTYVLHATLSTSLNGTRAS